MTEQDEKIADLELEISFYKNEIDKCNKVNIELTEQLRIGVVSNRRELLIATLHGWQDYKDQGISIEDYVGEIESNL